jgi:hypothetical protein
MGLVHNIRFDAATLQMFWCSHLDSVWTSWWREPCGWREKMGYLNWPRRWNGHLATPSKGGSLALSASLVLPYIGCPTEFIKIFTELLNNYRSTRGCERTQVLPRLWCNLKQFHSEFKGCFPTLWNSAHCATHNVAPLSVNAKAQYDMHGAFVTTSDTTKVTPSLCMPSCSRRTTTYEAVLTCTVIFTHAHIPSLPY